MGRVMVNHIELPAPHGFLIWRGKQTAIALKSDVHNSDKVLIVSNDEAFGYAKLSKQPALFNHAEFAKHYDEHKVTPEEHKLLFSDTKELYMYRIVDWSPFREPKPFEDGAIVDGISDEDKQLFNKLPKTIILEKDAVTLNGSQFSSSHESDYVSKIIEATYDTEIKQVDTQQDLTLYQLALVRVPNPRYKKKVKQIEDDNMPWSIEKRDDEWCVIKDDDNSVEGCHDTETAAEDQLTALNIAESESEQSSVSDETTTNTKQEESISQMIDRIRQQFMDQHCEEFDCPWVRDIFDAHLIVDWDGLLFRVPYLDTDGIVTFANRGAWKEVEVAYIDKMIELDPESHLKHYEKETDDTPTTNRTWRDKLKSAAKTVLDFVSLEDDTIEDDNKSILDIVDFTKPYGIAVKTVDGEPWHFTWSTNAFEDREGEIFAIQALKDYVIESANRDDKGTFDFWHIPGADFAKKEWQYIPDNSRFLIEAGPYLDNDLGQRAKEFFSEYPDSHPEIAPEGWGASPEFRYLPEDRADGVYDWLWITKTSTLPKSAAANIYTKGSQIMSNAQRDAGIKIFGEENIQNLDELAAKQTDALEAANVNTKANGEESPSEDTPTQATELDMETLGQEIAKQFSVDFGAVAESVNQLGEIVKGLNNRVEELESGKILKQNNETPRFVFKWESATESEDTEVKDNDPLKESKPKESQTKSESAVMDAIFNR